MAPPRAAEARWTAAFDPREKSAFAQRASWLLTRGSGCRGLLGGELLVLGDQERLLLGLVLRNVAALKCIERALRRGLEHGIGFSSLVRGLQPRAHQVGRGPHQERALALVDDLVVLREVLLFGF